MALMAATSWIGTVVLIMAVVAANELFLETHRRRYGLWRTARQRRFWASQDERRFMWEAVTRRDPDRRVELARLVLIAIVLVAFIGLLALLPGRAPGG